MPGARWRGRCATSASTFPRRAADPAHDGGMTPFGAPAQHLLGEFPTYAAAEKLVDKLADRGFAVETVRIVGNALRSVEYVTGRLTTRRAATAGAASGAWFGLMIGVLLGFLGTGEQWVARVVTAVTVGIVGGASSGAGAPAAPRTRREFSSRKTFEAESYSVYVDAEHADEAIRAAGL